MTFGYPQITMTVFAILACIVNIIRHDKVKPVHNFYVSGSFWVFEVFLLSSGRFFLTGWQWPQISWAILSGVSLYAGAMAHGKKNDMKYNGPMSFIGAAIVFIIYYFGGFFG